MKTGLTRQTVSSIRDGKLPLTISEHVNAHQVNDFYVIEVMNNEIKALKLILLYKWDMSIGHLTLHWRFLVEGGRWGPTH